MDYTFRSFSTLTTDDQIRDVAEDLIRSGANVYDVVCDVGLASIRLYVERTKMPVVRSEWAIKNGFSLEQENILRSLILNKQKIPAIKQVRTWALDTNLSRFSGLKESKDVVDALANLMNVSVW